MGGEVRAFGTGVAPPIAQTVTCPTGTSTASRPEESSTGQVGPSLELGAVEGDPSSVEVRWSVLGPPPVLDVDGTGPDCQPDAAVAGFRTVVPVATLRQHAPFTLSMAAPWTVDATNVFGRTTCTGSISQSVTLQRVNEDGSPLLP